MSDKVQVSDSETVKCSALTWISEEREYEECSVATQPPAFNRVRLEGLLTAVEVTLCWTHQRYFCSNPPRWKSMQVIDVETGKQVMFDGAKRILKSKAA